MRRVRDGLWVVFKGTVSIYVADYYECYYIIYLLVIMCGINVAFCKTTETDRICVLL